MKQRFEGKARPVVSVAVAVAALCAPAAADAQRSTAQNDRAVVDPPPVAISEVLGRAVVDESVRIKHRGPTEVVTQRLTVPAGNPGSGWHSHPGPHLVSIVSGESTIYEADCSRRTYRAGEAFLVRAGQVHLARNEGTTEQVQLVTHIVPPGAVLLVPEPAPPRCTIAD